jgi:hypothetical protein
MFPTHDKVAPAHTHSQSALRMVDPRSNLRAVADWTVIPRPAPRAASPPRFQVETIRCHPFDPGVREGRAGTLATLHLSRKVAHMRADPNTRV